MTTRLTFRSRAATVAAVCLSIVGLGAFAQAIAYWLSSDSTTPAVAAAASMQAPAAPTVSLSARQATVSWAATTTTNGVTATGYRVLRYSSAAGAQAEAATGACAGTLTTLSCTEADVPTGTWRYVVVAQRYSWSSPESSTSSPITVTVAATPTFTVTANQILATLPASVGGASLSGFPAGDSMAFRLDSSSGTTLSSTVTAVNASGAASGFSITVPAGVADGLHTIVAVGGSGTTATSGSFRVDTTNPTISSSSAPAANPAGWNKDDVSVTLTASDGGSGLASITYSASGAQTIASTSVTASPANVTITAEGTTTISYTATDNGGRTSSGSQVVKLDKTGPVVGSPNLPAYVKSGQRTLQLSGTSDPHSGVVSASYFSCFGTGCTPTTAIGSSTSAASNYGVLWTAPAAEGVYRVKVEVLDVAGNLAVTEFQTVVDNTAPTALTCSVGNGNGASVSLSGNAGTSPGDGNVSISSDNSAVTITPAVAVVTSGKWSASVSGVPKSTTVNFTIIQSDEAGNSVTRTCSYTRGNN